MIFGPGARGTTSSVERGTYSPFSPSAAALEKSCKRPSGDSCGGPRKCQLTLRFCASKGQILWRTSGRGKHNARHTDLGIEHCDPATAPELIAGQDDAAGAWKTLMTKARLDPDGVRKNGTVALEWMATASPEWFAKASPEEVAEWAHTSLDFITKRAGGKHTVLSAHFHLDETTPHLQILTCPLVKKSVKKRGRKAAGAPAEEAETAPEWRLSAKDVIEAPETA